MKVVDFHDFPNFSGKFGKLRDPPPYYVQASTHSTSPRTPSGGGPSALMARREQRLSLSRSLADVEFSSVLWTLHYGQDTVSLSSCFFLRGVF